MKQRFFLVLLSLVYLIIANSCATTDEGEVQALYLEEKIRENPHIIELYMYLIDYFWNEKVNLRETLRIANDCVRNNANNAQAHILAAQVLCNTGNIKAGEDFLHRRIEERRNYEALLMLSEQLRDSGKYDDARSLILNNWEGINDSDNKDESPADELSGKSEKFDDLFQLELARLNFSTLNFTDASKMCEKLVETSSNTQVFNASGILLLRIYAKTDEFEKADELTNKMLMKSELSQDFIELMTYVFINQEKHHELANRLVKIYKKTQNVELRQTIMFQLVLNEIMRDNIDEALKFVKLGLEIKPVYAPFLIFDYYLNLYNPDEKNEDKIEAKREVLDSYDLHYFKAPAKFENFKKILTGNLLRYLGLTTQADETYKNVLEDDADSIWAMLALAELTLDERKYNEAVYWYYKVMPLTERNSGLYCQIADCFIRLGEYNKALGAFKSSLRAFPGNKRALKGIEIARVLNGEYKLQLEFPYIFPQE